METNHNEWAYVDEQGRLVLPSALTHELGLTAGAQFRVERGTNHLRIHRPNSHLSKIYIEPTDLCNLDCTMCIRSSWDEPLGRMSEATFAHILSGLQELQQPVTVFFGGLGEPLFHPKTVEWVRAAKQAGARVELITNGTTLTEKRSRQLIEYGLDVLWVSIDGATPQSYADVRLGAELPAILENVQRFSRMRPGGHKPYPLLGVAFVAMKDNIADLSAVIKLGKKLGASLFSVSNVMPYTETMQAQRLYSNTLKNIAYMSSPWLPSISLPKMDIDDSTREAFFQALNSSCNVSYAGNNFSRANDVCNFIASGSMSIAWDGGVSPCWPLMHDHVSYLHGKERRVYRHVVGNVNQRSVMEIWDDPGYVAYRQKVQNFGFAPCTFCGGCELSESNLEDCLGNEFPTCGGCLWSQGVIQCP